MGHDGEGYRRRWLRCTAHSLLCSRAPGGHRRAQPGAQAVQGLARIALWAWTQLAGGGGGLVAFDSNKLRSAKNPATSLRKTPDGLVAGGGSSRWR